MLTVVDSFKNAPLEYPADTERETNMHNTFGALVSSVDAVFQKYGVKEITAEIGDKVDVNTMLVETYVDGDEEGIITDIVRSGFLDD